MIRGTGSGTAFQCFNNALQSLAAFNIFILVACPCYQQTEYFYIFIIYPVLELLGFDFSINGRFKNKWWWWWWWWSDPHIPIWTSCDPLTFKHPFEKFLGIGSLFPHIFWNNSSTVTYLCCYLMTSKFHSSSTEIWKKLLQVIVTPDIVFPTSRMAESPRLANGRIDVDRPRWEQRTFIGRLKHFAWVTDYRSAFVSNARLLEAKTLVQQYR